MEINLRTQFGELLQHHNLTGHSIEIGVAEGRFSEHIISWPTITKHYMLDAWERLNQKGDGGFPQSWHDNNFIEAKQRTEPFKDKRLILKGLSKEMIQWIPDNSLIFAYLDGDHSYEGCLSDLQLIYPKVRYGGIIAGHDYLSPQYGVNRAIKDFLATKVETTDWGTANVPLHETFEDGDKSMVSFWFIKR